MKKAFLLCMVLLSFCMSCAQKFHVENVRVQHLAKEVPQMILISGMDYFGGFTCEGSAVNADSLDVYIGSFYMSKHEITNKDFCCFLNEDSIRINVSVVKAIIAIGAEQNKITVEHGRYIPVKGFENYPVVMVSWWGARRYCQWLTSFVNKRNIEKGKPSVPYYRVPSEFEWVYATARSEKQNDFILPVCDELVDIPIDSISIVHNIKQDSLIRTRVAGMNENVYEWTEDDFYVKKSVSDYNMHSFYSLNFSANAVVRTYGLGVSDNITNSCGRISRLRTGFYSDVGFRIVQTSLGRSSGMEF